MKTLIKVIILISIYLPASAYMDPADRYYFNPPQWNLNQYFTHQPWSFESDQLPLSFADPAAPDGQTSLENPYGSPGMYYFYCFAFQSGYMQTDDFTGSQRTGFYGGMGDTTCSFYIPGPQEPLSQMDTQIWIQSSFYARNDETDVYSLQIALDQDITDFTAISVISENLEVLDEPVADFGKWYRLTALYKISGTPQQFFVSLKANKLPAELLPEDRFSASMIDNMDIDTRIVPKGELDAQAGINFNDFEKLAYSWKTDSPLADLDDNGTIDISDLVIQARNWLWND